MSSAISSINLRISVIVLTKDRLCLVEHLFRSLREAILRAASTVPRLEIRIQMGINGGTSSYQKQIIDLLSQTELVDCTTVNLLQNLKPGDARNAILAADTSEPAWWLFLDDDTIVPKSIFLNFVKLLEAYPHLEVFGGPNLLPPPEIHEQNRFEIAQDRILSDSLATGPVSQRYRRDKKRGYFFTRSTLCMTLCNLFLKAHPRTRVFPPEFICGEELVGLKQYRRPYVFSNTLAVYHFRRATLKQFAVQSIKYGIGRGQASPWSSVAVGIFGAFAIGAFLISPVATSMLFLSLYALYGFIVVCRNYQACRQTSVSTLGATLLTCHIGYTFGLLGAHVLWIRQNLTRR